MGLVHNDLDKRIYAAFEATNEAYRRMSDSDVIRAIADIWVASGGEADGFDEEYIGKIRDEIARVEAE